MCDLNDETGASKNEVPNEFRLSRRAALATLAGGPVMAVSGLLSPTHALDLGDALGTEAFLDRVFSNVCMVATEAVEGPYYIDERILRADIRDGKPGLPIDLELTIVNANARCAPVEGTLVSIWHCDADGEYSGYLFQNPDGPADFSTMDPRTGHVPPQDAERFLRGAQVTDAQGRVKFTTIFPGWYRPRAAHVHVRVYLSETASLTTQLYFPDSICSAVYSSEEAYRARGASPFNNVNDPMRRQSGITGSTDILDMSQSADGRLVGVRTIGASHL